MPSWRRFECPVMRMVDCCTISSNVQGPICVLSLCTKRSWLGNVRAVEAWIEALKKLNHSQPQGPPMQQLKSRLVVCRASSLPSSFSDTHMAPVKTETRLDVFSR
ncbi:hypothetical protein H257_07349 [Aphanomyces astaci]|uniref:Uncharacterized protein n=1 Tax=Aphanomyces astaci TaxID=112090 RepID=W4GI00_APHAT|nr:hypothetical protein H257_07349 [Aphanomyces astaci]ETV79297.1 hypothetical protein H257_07349 [Aphanomyces astaci]|eukprot:XP_009831138.1 hypothetical protein H257_07349 [Aphanomyces astaci]